MAAQVQDEVPSSVARWKARPAPLSTTKCGNAVQFSKNCSVAERVVPDLNHNKGVVYTEDPLPVGQVWQVTILSTIIERYQDGLVSIFI